MNRIILYLLAVINLKTMALGLLFLFLANVSNAQKLVQYKQVDTTKLFVEVFNPPELDDAKNYPAIVYFFGGGWRTGDRSKFYHHAKHFSEKGFVCVVADYRIEKKHGTTPFEALKDAKSAMRFVRKNADRFHIDPNKIIAAGGSAGGHLAAATGTIEKFNEPTDDLSISCVPNAMILYNAVVDISPGGYGYDRIGDEYKDFSPLHNLDKDTPPTILLLGTKDFIIPVETALYYKAVMDKLKIKCEAKIYEGGKHGFFNYNKKDPFFYESCNNDVENFLMELGLMSQ